MFWSLLVGSWTYVASLVFLMFVRINLFLLPIFPPSSHSIVVSFFPVGLSSLSRHSQQVLFGDEVSSVSWIAQFKSLVIIIVGWRIFFLV